MSDTVEIPEGFKVLRRASSRFLSSLGPLYAKEEGSGVVIGLRIDERHLNTRGVAHGGMLVTLADSAARSLRVRSPMLARAARSAGRNRAADGVAGPDGRGDVVVMTVLPARAEGRRPRGR